MCRSASKHKCQDYKNVSVPKCQKETIYDLHTWGVYASTSFVTSDYYRQKLYMQPKYTLDI
jgi:hypothetical protein